MQAGITQAGITQKGITQKGITQKGMPFRVMIYTIPETGVYLSASARFMHDLKITI